MAEKTSGLRLFADAEDKMNLGLGRRRRSRSRRFPVHALRQRREGQAAELHRCRAPRGGDSALRALRRALRERGLKVETGEFGDDGRRARERRARDPLAGAMSDCRVVLASRRRAGASCSTSSASRTRCGRRTSTRSMRPGESRAPRRASRAREGERRREREPDLITIGADTIVVVNGNVLGKPADDERRRA